jgi:hypothetical protein
LFTTKSATAQSSRVSGEETTQNIPVKQSPWLGFFRRHTCLTCNWPTCGGVIIAPDVVLTKKICTHPYSILSRLFIEDEYLSSDNMKFHPGISQRKEANSSNEYEIKKIIPHPTQGLALLQLKNPIHYNDSTIKEINYVRSKLIKPINIQKEHLCFYGLGERNHGIIPGQLYNRGISKLCMNAPSSRAIRYYDDFIRNYMSRVAGAQTYQIDHGDCGGGLVYCPTDVMNDQCVLLGIGANFQYNNTNADEEYISFHRISYILDWIIENVEYISALMKNANIFI